MGQKVLVLMKSDESIFFFLYETQFWYCSLKKIFA